MRCDRMLAMSTICDARLNLVEIPSCSSSLSVSLCASQENLASVIDAGCIAPTYLQIYYMGNGMALDQAPLRVGIAQFPAWCFETTSEGRPKRLYLQ